VSVREGAPIIEIETDAARPTISNSASEAERTALAQAAAARSAAGTLQREVEHASVEVQRVEALVAQQRAPPSQLDAARAVYQQAQERLQQGKDVATTSPINPNDNPDAARVRSTQSGANTILVRATTAGDVRVVAVRAGQRVSAGQPVVTLASGS